MISSGKIIIASSQLFEQYTSAAGDIKNGNADRRMFF